MRNSFLRKGSYDSADKCLAHAFGGVVHGVKELRFYVLEGCRHLPTAAWHCLHAAFNSGPANVRRDDVSHEDTTNIRTSTYPPPESTIHRRITYDRFFFCCGLEALQRGSSIPATGVGSSPACQHLHCTLGTWHYLWTAVPFWGQTTQISSSLSPKRDCGPKGVKSVGVEQS